MRKARLKVSDRPAVYHCISRVVGGQHLLEDPAKEQFRRLLWQQTEFCGLQLLTYAVLANHFHLLTRVPAPEEIPDAELVRRARVLYPPEDPFLKGLEQTFESQGCLPAGLRRRLLRRMGDLSVFMKELKQGFSRWYNGTHERFGTLWAERFKSLLVEDEPEALSTVAAYIDLNAVRAGRVGDPKDYRFCGYGEAAAGNPVAQAGLMSFLPPGDWAQAGAEYRERLFVRAGQSGQSGKIELGREQILAVVAQGGQISPGEALRLRIRYFTDGWALGSELYVNQVFAQFRDRFGPKRRTGARPLRGLPFVRLRTLRDLKVQVLS